MDLHRQGITGLLRTGLLFSLAAWITAQAANFQLEPFAGGLRRPVMLTAPPGDTERVFIAEQHSGFIRIYHAQTGEMITNNFLRVTGITTGGEQGLLGLAFHPQYAENGYFYVNYTAPGGGAAGHTEIARYQAIGDPVTAISADPASRTVILTYDQPESNHNGGWLGFGLDGYLYISSGDGGGGNDIHGPIGNGQDRTTLLGKILRIDVDIGVDGGQLYAIPDGNPFKSHPTYAEEIWAFGLRNPWRCSIDRETGDLWIGDVGQGAREEIDYIPAGEAGRNFGWRPREGDIQTPGFGSETPVTPATGPIFAYPRDLGYCVTGGYIYRGSQIPELQGKYIFADFGSENFWVVSRDGTTFTTELRTADFQAPNLDGVSSFGEDGSGELYLCTLGGTIFKIVPILPPAPEIGDARLSGSNELLFTFQAIAGTGYVVEFRPSIASGAWTPVGTYPAQPEDAPITVTNAVDGNAGFFRVRLETN